MTYPLSFVTKRGSNFGYENSHVLRGSVSIGDYFIRGSVFVYEGCSEDCIFSLLSILDTLFLHCDSKPYTLFDIYIDEVVITFFSPISSCVVSFLSLCTCFLFIV